MISDIKTKDDIKKIIDQFYGDLLTDKLLSHFFTNHMLLKIEDHLPIMYNFWESVILDGSSYRGNPMMKHIELHQKSPLEKKHFDRWVDKWEETVKANYKGPNAIKAVEKAKSIRALIEFKINRSNGDSPYLIL